MKICSYNEWDTLKTVIVGTASVANFPVNDILYTAAMQQGGWNETPPPTGPVPQWIIDETNEDLDILASTLEELGVEVHRPLLLDYQKENGQYGYCPRDNLLVLGDRVIEAPMSTKARQMEMKGFRDIRRAAIQDGARWFTAPEPDLHVTENFDANGFKLNEVEPVFDAANIARFGRNLLYLVSSSANKRGAEWLQNMLGNELDVYTTDVYNSAHIDSTIVPIDEDYVVLNANRVKEEDLPWFIKEMTKIWITDDMIVPQGFYEYPYASKWIAMNMLAIGDKRVICDKNQPKIISRLEASGFTVVPLELRHARTLGGGFHCVTVDLERE